MQLEREKCRGSLAFVSQKNGAIACGKKGCLLTRGGDSDGAGMGPESTVVEFGKFANATANARTDGQGPQDAPLAKLNISVAPSGLKVFNVLLRGSRKEKKLVKIPLARQFCFAGWQDSRSGPTRGEEESAKTQRTHRFRRRGSPKLPQPRVAARRPAGK